MRKVDPARYRAKCRGNMNVAAPLFAAQGLDGTATWIQTPIGALFLRAATETGFDAAAHISELRAVPSRRISPVGGTGPRRGPGPG